METATISEGALRLKAELVRRGLSGVDAAKACDVSAAQISRILSGDRMPGRGLAVALRDKYGVDPALWDRTA